MHSRSQLWYFVPMLHKIIIIFMVIRKLSFKNRWKLYAKTFCCFWENASYLGCKRPSITALLVTAINRISSLSFLRKLNRVFFADNHTKFGNKIFSCLKKFAYFRLASLCIMLWYTCLGFANNKSCHSLLPAIPGSARV